MAVTYQNKKCRSGGLLLDSNKSPQHLTEDLDHVLGIVTRLNPTLKIKDLRKVPAGPAQEKFLPGIKFGKRYNLKTSGPGFREEP